MPLPNNHACELRDSSEFDQDTIRSRKQVHDGKEYTVRFGKEKDSGETDDISYLYPTETWKEGEARSHCQDHDGTFVAASGGEGGSLNLDLPSELQFPEGFLSRMAATPWAMLQPALQTVFGRANEQERKPPELEPSLYERESAPEAKSLDVPRESRTVAVVPVYGVIDKNRIYWADVFTDELSPLLASLVANPDIGAIVLDVDSPGGAVYGVPELAEQVRSYRGVKPIYSVATGDMASAAYWIGSAAAKSFAAPSARVGSIGVWAAHTDWSKAFDDFGIKVTLISAGKYKVEGNPFEALGDEARSAIQDEVNTYYDQFVGAVAKNRNRRESTVKSGFGEGRILVAERALDEGLIDGIATLPELLGAIVPRRKGSRSASARARLAIEEANG